MINGDQATTMICNAIDRGDTVDLGLATEDGEHWHVVIFVGGELKLVGESRNTRQEARTLLDKLRTQIDAGVGPGAVCVELKGGTQWTTTRH